MKTSKGVFRIPLSEISEENGLVFHFPIFEKKVKIYATYLFSRTITCGKSCIIHYEESVNEEPLILDANQELSIEIQLSSCGPSNN